jgi:hypothetical protein
MSLSPSGEIYDSYSGDKNHRQDLYNYMSGMENIQREKELKLTTCQKGGFLGLFESGIGKYLTDAKKSERALVKSHQKMSNTIKEWTKTYDKHLANLAKLDEFMSTGESLQTIFKDILVKNYFRKFGEKIDTSIPLFLDNYNANKDSTPNDFKNEHIEKQVRYVLRTEFGSVEDALIKFISVRILNDSEVQIILRTIENKIHERTIPHRNLNLDFPDLRSALADVIKSAKKDMSFNINELKEKSAKPPSYMVKPLEGEEGLNQYLQTFGVNSTRKNNTGKNTHNYTLYEPRLNIPTTIKNTSNKGAANGAATPAKPFNMLYGVVNKREEQAKKEEELRKAREEAERQAKENALKLAEPKTNVVGTIYPSLAGMPVLTKNQTNSTKPATVQNTLSNIKQTIFSPPSPTNTSTQSQNIPVTDLSSIITPNLQNSLSPSVVEKPSALLCFRKSKEECASSKDCYYDERIKRCRFKSS